MPAPLALVLEYRCAFQLAMPVVKVAERPVLFEYGKGENSDGVFSSDADCWSVDMPSAIFVYLAWGKFDITWTISGG